MQIASSPKHLRRVLAALLLLAVIVFTITGGYLFWRDHRPQPTGAHERLFGGITYIRDVRQQPRPLVIHVVQIDLDTPGLSFLVTPGNLTNGHEVRAQTTSQFLERFNLQLAINGDFFWPWWSHSIFDYYPHVGDPTDVNGFAASRGDVYSRAPKEQRPTLFLSKDNQASVDHPVGAVYNALSGIPLIVERGRMSDQIKPDEYYAGVNPRTAAALDRTGRILMLIVVDGRQPNYSEGVTLPELAEIAIEYGADTALNLDGGGSSTLVVGDQQGRPHVLNSPIDSYVPGRERPVGNHLGVYARKAETQRNR